MNLIQSSNKVDLAKAKLFQYELIYRILSLPVGQVKEKEITRKNTRGRFSNIEYMLDAQRRIQLLFISSLVRFEELKVLTDLVNGIS